MYFLNGQNSCIYKCRSTFQLCSWQGSSICSDYNTNMTRKLFKYIIFKFHKTVKTQKKKISHRLKAEDIYTFLLRVLMVSRVTVFPQFSNLLISELSRTIVKQQADEEVARWNCICMTTKWQPLSGTILKSIWQLWFFVGSKGRGTNNSNIEIENLLKIVQTTEMRS